MAGRVLQYRAALDDRYCGPGELPAPGSTVERHSGALIRYVVRAATGNVQPERQRRCGRPPDNRLHVPSIPSGRRGRLRNRSPAAQRPSSTVRDMTKSDDPRNSPAITPNPEGDVLGICSRLGCTAPTLSRDACELHKPRPWDRSERRGLLVDSGR